MIVEACIVTFGSSAVVGDAIESLRHLPAGSRVAVHDNCPDDGSLAVARQSANLVGLELRAEECKENCGFASACNSLARSSTADLLLFLNPDAWLLNWPDDLTEIENTIAAPTLLGRSGELLRNYGDGRRTLPREAAERWLRIKPRPPDNVGYVGGAVLLIPREMFLHMGGFDSRFFMYYEDIDLCLRANSHGYSVRLRPDWLAQHAEAHAAKRDPVVSLVRSYESGRRYYAKSGQSVHAYDALCLIDGVARTLLGITGLYVRYGPQHYKKLVRHICKRIGRPLQQSMR
ncbi:glycosyltransferase [Frankia sp. Cj3]|uniref:glycosyltransferase n=1 Tax=Frankia sp. Cj3 TaxID=2880976 RepID=UPI00351CF711